MKVVTKEVFLVLLSFNIALTIGQNCAKKSVTKASGSSVRKAEFCPGELIFEDNFDRLDQGKWQNEVTLGGGGNWEFQWYTNDRENSFTKNGKLHLRPSLTADKLGEASLTSGTIDLGRECTNDKFYGCKRVGNPTNILNPVRSARVHTTNSFSFKYGRLEVRAKLPAGDWLWPAIWLLPKAEAYGGWPRSGEIDLMESRGNRNLNVNGVNIGTKQMASTLHFGPDPNHNGWQTSHFELNSAQGLDEGFHNYILEWTPNNIKFLLDGNEIKNIPVGEGFWKRGGFPSNMNNLWQNGEKMAPFDKEFYIILNLAVGGTNGYFPDNAGGKPWSNTSPQAAGDFWNGRNQWLPSWDVRNKNNENVAMQVDYVRVYAL